MTCPRWPQELAASHKTKKHRSWHNCRGFGFVQLSASTHGQMNNDFICLIYFFADMIMTKTFAARGWNTHTQPLVPPVAGVT